MAHFFVTPSRPGPSPRVPAVPRTAALRPPRTRSRVLRAAQSLDGPSSSDGGERGLSGPGAASPSPRPTAPVPDAPAAAPAAAAASADPSPPPLSTRDDEDATDLLESTPAPPADGGGASPSEPAPAPAPPPPRTRRTSAAASFLLHELGLSRAQVAAVGLQLLRRDVRELRAHAGRLERRGVSAADAPAAVAACPALLTSAGAAAAAALLAQAGLRRGSTGAALCAFPSLLDAPGTGLAGALGGLLADAAAAACPSSALAALPVPTTLPLRLRRQPSALRSPAVDVRLHPVAAALIAAGARPGDVAALARAAPGLLATRAGRSALEWLWTRGVPAADAVAAGLALGCPGLCAATSRLLTELEAAGLRAPDGLRLVLSRPRLRRAACAGDGRHAARRVRAALRALRRAGVPPHALPGVVLAAPEVLERGLGPGPRALARAGLSPPEVGAVVAAVPRLALAGRGRAAPDPRRVLAQLSALGLSPPAIRTALVSAPVLAATPPSALRASARALVASGIPRRALPSVLEAAPGLLAAGPDGVRAQVAFLAGVGVHSGAAAARWPALLDPARRAQVRFLRSRHGLRGARALGRALVAWPHLHGFGEVGSSAAASPPSPTASPATLLPPVPAGLHDLRSFLAALAGGSGPALDALLASPAPPAVPRPTPSLALSPGAAARARPATPAGAADAAVAAAAAAAGASPAAVALLAAGVPWRGLVAAACLAPALLSPALAHPLARRLAALRDAAGLDGEGLGRLLRWSAAALADAPPGGLRAAAAALAAAGVPDALLGRALLSAPGLLLLGGPGGGSKPASAVAALAALGLDPPSIAAAVSRCPPLLLHSPADLADRAAVLRRFGLDAPSVARAAARCPVLLTLPLGRPRYAEVAAFLEARLGRDAASAIAAHPAVLIYSLRNRVAPRARFLAARWAASARPGSGVRPPTVHPATAPLSAWLAMGDAEFCTRVARAPRAEYEGWRANEGSGS